MTNPGYAPSAQMAADRVAGSSYKDIAAKYGVSVSLVRTFLRRAMLAGHVSADEIRYKPVKNAKPSAPDGEYNARWMQKVISNVTVDPSGCWLWNGKTGEWGYAMATYRRGTRSVHRLVYQILNGVKLTRWQLVMHKCDVPHCVNPAHLQVGTPHDNVQDAANKGRHHNARKTRCKRGHEFTEENTYLTPAGTRACVACRRARMRIEMGWSEQDAYSIPTIAANETTIRRKFGRKSA